jgi:hypothetical protein
LATALIQSRSDALLAAVSPLAIKKRPRKARPEFREETPKKHNIGSEGTWADVALQ